MTSLTPIVVQSNQTIDFGYDTYIFDGATSSVFTLPNSAGLIGRNVRIKNNTIVDGVTVTVIPFGSEGIETSYGVNPLSVVINRGKEFNIVVANGGFTWYEISDESTGTYPALISNYVQISSTTGPTGVPPGSTGVSVGKLKTITLKGNYALVTYQENPGWLFTFNVSNINVPTIVSPNTNYIIMNNGPNGPDLVGNLMMIPTNTGLIYAINVTNPAALSLYSTIQVGSFGQQCFDVAINGNNAYVAQTADVGGVYRLDVTNPASMSILGSATGYVASTVASKGSYVYVGGQGGLRIYNLSLTQLGIVSLPGSTYSVALHPTMNYAYLANYSSPIIYAVDVTTPTTPVVTATVPLPDGSAPPNFTNFSITSNNQVSIINTTNGHVYFMSILNPSTPVVYYTFVTGLGSLDGMTVDDNNNIYVSNRTGEPGTPNTMRIYSPTSTTYYVDRSLFANGIITPRDFTESIFYYTATSGTLNYAVTSGDAGIVINMSGGTATVTLEANPAQGRYVRVKNRGSISVTIAGNGKLINGSSSLVLTTGTSSFLQYSLDPGAGWTTF